MIKKGELLKRDKQKFNFCLRNKDFYYSFNNVLEKKYNFKDLLIVFFFSFFMKKRNLAEVELKRIITQYAIKIYSIILTTISFIASAVTSGFNIQVIVLSTIFYFFLNISIVLLFSIFKFNPDESFFSRLSTIFNDVNLSFTVN